MATPKAATKSEVFKELADKAELSKKQVTALFDALTEFIRKQVGKKGPGVFTLPGLLKIKRVKKLATKEREGFNPATHEKIIIKAKPERTVVRCVPLKNLKEMVK